MEDDLAANLKNYEIQLQQVVAALGEDGSGASGEAREELLKLQTDLEEVIKLTIQLMTNSGGSGTSSAATSSAASSGMRYKTGDKVLAPWSEDGLYYEAIIDDITSDGQCNVTFYGLNAGAAAVPGKKRKARDTINEVCLLSLLKPIEGGPSGSGGSKGLFKKGGSNGGAGAGPEQATRVVSREQLKKKQLKKASKMKELEDEREKEKNKWQNFTHKIKGTKGIQNKAASIFASPEGVEGRVGIGTCGISGKPMTPSVNSSSLYSSLHSSLNYKKMNKKQPHK